MSNDDGITLVVTDIKGKHMIATCVETGERMRVPIVPGIKKGDVLRKVKFKGD